MNIKRKNFFRDKTEILQRCYWLADKLHSEIVSTLKRVGPADWITKEWTIGIESKILIEITAYAMCIVIDKLANEITIMHGDTAETQDYLMSYCCFLKGGLDEVFGFHEDREKVFHALVDRYNDREYGDNYDEYREIQTSFVSLEKFCMYRLRKITYGVEPNVFINILRKNFSNIGLSYYDDAFFRLDIQTVEERVNEILIGNFKKRSSFSKNNNVLTDPFFDIFQGYCKTLKVIFDKQGFSFEKAAKLEVALFLLFRVDFLLQKSPNQVYRQLLFERCLERVATNISKQLLDICYLRLQIYGEIYNDDKEKKDGVFSNEFLSFSYDWLISAIKLCKDEYSLMAKKRFIPLSLETISNYPIKVALQELDIHYIKQFFDYIKIIDESIKSVSEKTRKIEGEFDN